MTAEAALLGVPRQIIHEGVSYPVHLIGKKEKAEFERAFAARALERLKKNKSNYTRKEYLAELRILGEREDRGAFAFLSQAGLTTILTTTWGQETLLRLLMPGCPRETFATILDEQSEEITWLLRRIMQESFPETMKAGQDEVPLDGPAEKPESTTNGSRSSTLSS
jgi:hypothetical protein